MIGKEIRSLRQLAKETDSSLRGALINFRERGWSYCNVICVKDFKTLSHYDDGERLFIFNSITNYGNVRFSHSVTHPSLNGLREKIESNCCGKLMSLTKEEYNNPMIYSIISGIVLFPETFEDDYCKFLKDNAKTIRLLNNKYGFYEGDVAIKKIFAYTGGSKNFFVWAMNAIFTRNATSSTVKKILWWNDNYSQLAKKLSRGTITAYVTHNDINLLFDECHMLRIEKRINDVINTFNTAQKKILRELALTNDDKKMFSRFYRLSESKKKNFIQKVSTISDPLEILRQMRHATSEHFSWSKESLLDFIANADGINCEIVYENGSIVLVRVKDFDTIKNIAKTTNWCISKNKTYWNQYLDTRDESEQYVMFDFSQKEDSLTSIVGFTCRYNNGITNAHDFTNNNILEDYAKPSMINSYISHLKENSNIYALLKKNGIDINLVTKYDKPLYDWNKESMYKYLYECVDKNNVTILTDKNDLVALSIKDKNVKYFLGDAYIDNFNSSYNSWRHIIFMDFSLSSCDPNKILFAIVQEGTNGNEDMLIAFKNEHCNDSTAFFNDKLFQYGLPYDTIKRIVNKSAMLRDAIQSQNMIAVAESIKSPEILRQTIENYIGPETMTDYIRTSICDYASFDYLDIFYNSNYRVSDFLGLQVTILLMRKLLNSYFSMHTNNCCQIPKQNDIKAFFNKETTSVNQAVKIATFLAIDKMLYKETLDVIVNERIYNNLLTTILESNYKGSAIDHFVEVMLDNVGDSLRGDFLQNMFCYVTTNGGKKIKEKLETLKEKNSSLEKMFDETANGKHISYKIPLDYSEYFFSDYGQEEAREEEEDAALIFEGA